jgi:hypothetical protein
MGRGHNAEAARILERIAPRQKAMLAAMAQRLGKKIHHVAKTRPGQRMGFWTLFSPEYRRRTLLVTLPWFFMDVATYGVGLFTTILLGTMRNGENVGIMNGVGRGLANALDSGKVDIFLLLGSLLSLWMVPWLGRIHMQMIGFGGMTLGMGLLYVATELAGGTAAHPQIILSGFMVFNLFMTAGPNATTFILPTEMYPTQVRAFSAGFAAAVAKIGATISVFLLPVIQSALGVTVILLLMGTVSLLGLVLTYHFRVQGRGLTLEEHHGPALPQ